MPRTRVLVVSLPESHRRATFADRARDAGMAWEFHDAHRDLAPGLVYDEAATRLRCGRGLKSSELGCYSSHYAIWQRLIEDEADQFIVLEDDVLVDWSMLRIVAGIDFAASGVDYLRLYYKAPARFLVRKRRYLTRSSSLLEVLSPAYGTQGYVITRGGARTLVPRCRRVIRPIDDQLDRFWDHGLPNLALFPFPIVEEAGASTIGDDRFVPKPFSLGRKGYNLVDLTRRRVALLRRRLTAQEWRAKPWRDSPT